jgi:hypothetical protein
MRYVLGVFIVAVVVFFAVPVFMGGNANICQGLEQYNVRTSAANIAGGTTGPVYGVINGVGQSVATGQAPTTTEANEHPNTPTPISCAISFWKTL